MPIKALDMSHGVNAYLSGKYGHCDMTWHPLFTACRDLFLYMMENS
jgi:hypothetical protein